MKLKLMRYVGNASRTDETRAISVGEDRPTIQMGGSGLMTDHEIHNAVSMGHVLTEVEDDVGSMDAKALEKHAAKLDLDVDEGAKKEELVEAVRAYQASGTESADAYAIGGTAVGASGGPTGTSTGGGPGPAATTTTGGPAT